MAKRQSAWEALAQERVSEARELLKEAAEEGDLDALADLALAYGFGGFGIEQDHVKYVELLEKGSNAGHALCHTFLARRKEGEVRQELGKKALASDNKLAHGFCYAFGLGVEQDYRKAFELFKEEAEKGVLLALFWLGTFYYEGRGTEKSDPAMSLMWLTKAAERGDVVAQYNVGMHYMNGEGVEKDPKAALVWFEKAARQGYAEGAFCAGLALRKNPHRTEEDLKQAVAWYQQAADAGHAFAQCNLGNCYANGSGVEKNGPLAMKWFRKAAQQGDSVAQYNVGNALEHGKYGEEVDLKRAFKYYMQAANGGHAGSQYCIGVFYTDGIVVQKDLKKAFEWHMRAAEAGEPYAQCSVGYYYHEVERNFAKAFHYYTLAAKQEHLNATFNLGLCYLEGKGTPIDVDKAAEYFFRAAQRGHARAQYHLGCLFVRGEGVGKSAKFAREWFASSAELGYGASQLQLAMLYARGEGGTHEEAMELLKKAAAQDTPGAKELLEELAPNKNQKSSKPTYFPWIALGLAAAVVAVVFVAKSKTEE